MTEQLSLLDYRPSSHGERLIEALRGRGWVKARELSPVLGIDDRALRAEAEVSDGRVISGQKGYCLSEEATVEDIRHCAKALMSQGKKMIKRALAILRYAFTRLKGVAA